MKSIFDSYRGIVFDFNGTLFWDTPLHNAAWFEYCEKYGIHLTPEIMFRKYHGKTNEMIFDAMFEGKLSLEEIGRRSIEKELMYQAICLQGEMALAPGAEVFLDALKERNFPFTIATASIQLNVDFYYEHLNLARWFPYDKIIFNDGTLPGKPDPTVYLKAMEILGCAPEETLIFEDSSSGLRAAMNAKAGGIIIVNSNDDDYSDYPFPQIKDFSTLLP
ncbi:MAG: HAD family phosphatase [Planctomycetia bacterium]|nr:HAD family phosphatase [Planctomycetia bacterium]